MIAKNLFNELIKIIDWTKNTFDPNYDQSDANDLLLRIYDELSSLRKDINDLDADLEETTRIFNEYGARAKTIHDICWEKITHVSDLSNLIFHINSLAWLSSNRGQNSLQWIEEEIKQLADEGRDNIIFEIYSEDIILRLNVKNNLKIENYFCSYFDLCEVMKFLGYKISSTTVTKFSRELTLRW